MKHQFACPRGRIDLFLKTFEMNAMVLKVVDYRHQMRQGTAKSIKFPHDQGITST
jgi:hypothetical protein